MQFKALSRGLCGLCMVGNCVMLGKDNLKMQNVICIFQVDLAHACYPILDCPSIANVLFWCQFLLGL